MTQAHWSRWSGRGQRRGNEHCVRDRRLADKRSYQVLTNDAAHVALGHILSMELAGNLLSQLGPGEIT
jgi:hypothetical protein